MTELEAKWASYTGPTYSTGLETPNGRMTFHLPMMLMEMPKPTLNKVHRMLRAPWAYTADPDFMGTIRRAWTDYDAWLEDGYRAAQAAEDKARRAIPEVVMLSPDKEKRKAQEKDIRELRSSLRAAEKVTRQSRRALTAERKKQQEFNELFADVD